MKRIFLLLLCLLLVAGCLLSLTACNSKTETDTKESVSETDTEETLKNHDLQKDLPAIEESDAAYLLDLDFAVTNENLSDCLYDYFSAPAVLTYSFKPHNDFYENYEQRRIQGEKTTDFIEPFRNVSMTLISKENLPNDLIDFYFKNAIEELTLYEENGTTYFYFCRPTPTIHDYDEVYFCVENIDLIPALNEIGILLREYSENIGDYNLYSDLPAIEKSDAAYLLDPDFEINSENFADCAEDYFSAPGMLYFRLAHSTAHAVKDCEKASAFGEIFRNVSLTEIQREDYPDYKHYRESYNFFNAIGTMELRSWQEETYLYLCRESSTGYDSVYFRTDGDLIAEIHLIEESLKEYSTETPLFEPPH